MPVMATLCGAAWLLVAVRIFLCYQLCRQVHCWSPGPTTAATHKHHDPNASTRLLRVARPPPQHRPRSGPKRSSFTLVSLVNTGALWAWAAEMNGVPSPTLLASVVPWGQPAPIYSDAMLRQPGGGADLAPGGASPVGFWSGGVSHGSAPGD